MLSGRFVQGHMLSAGDDRAGEGERWVSEETGEGSAKDFDSQAGVYRMGQRIVAVNRPEREDLSSGLDASEVRGLFGEVRMVLAQEKTLSGVSDDPKEIWQWFLVAMALALLIEGILILPKGADERVEIQTTTSGKVAAKGGV